MAIKSLWQQLKISYEHIIIVITKPEHSQSGKKEIEKQGITQVHCTTQNYHLLNWLIYDLTNMWQKNNTK